MCAVQGGSGVRCPHDVPLRALWKEFQSCGESNEGIAGRCRTRLRPGRVLVDRRAKAMYAGSGEAREAAGTDDDAARKPGHTSTSTVAHTKDLSGTDRGKAISRFRFMLLGEDDEIAANDLTLSLSTFITFHISDFAVCLSLDPIHWMVHFGLRALWSGCDHSKLLLEESAEQTLRVATGAQHLRPSKRDVGFTRDL